jgi:hypothetical protein
MKPEVQALRRANVSSSWWARGTGSLRIYRRVATFQRSRGMRADLNHAIQSTPISAGSEYKYVAKFETDFGEFPHI